MKLEIFNHIVGSFFYYTQPLKGTHYLNSLRKEKVLISEGLYSNDFYSPYECASEFLIYTIHTNYSANNYDAIRIIDIYEKAFHDGIVEAANNLGIIYHYLERYDLSEQYFKLACQGGSYFAALNLESFYLNEDMTEEFNATNLIGCTYSNPISLFNKALSNHLGIYKSQDIQQAIALYLKVLTLKDADIKYNVPPLEEDRDILYTMQERAANNLAVLYTEHKLAYETISNYPLVKWLIEFAQHADSLASTPSITIPTPELAFSVLMSRCFTQNDFTYLQDMLEEDAVLIIHHHNNTFGKEAIIHYFKDREKREREQKIQVIYSLKHLEQHDVWSLQADSPNYATTYYLCVFHHNKISRITMIQAAWLDHETLYQTCLDKKVENKLLTLYKTAPWSAPFHNALPCPICGTLSSNLKWQKIMEEDNSDIFNEINENDHVTKEEVYVSKCPKCQIEVEMIRCFQFDPREMFI